MSKQLSQLRFVACCRGLGAAHRELWVDSLSLVGVTLALLVYGVLQERIMTIGFGEERELFRHSVFLVLCNRLCTCGTAFVYMVATGISVKPAAPLHSYAAVSFSNVVATSCQYEALKYVSFALQTLAKSAKALPVMLWGTVIAGKRYKIMDYAQASIITMGCTVFILTGDVSSRVVSSGSGELYQYVGGSLMLLYLAVDGLTSTSQDKLFNTYNMSIADQVLYTTSFSTVLSFVAAIATGQLTSSLSFLFRYPEAFWWIFALSMSSAVVQLVISYTIKQYGAVVFATVMTTRQFFSILLSSVVFLNPLTAGQWAGTSLVFGALYYKAHMARLRSRKEKVAQSPAASLSNDPHAAMEHGVVMDGIKVTDRHRAHVNGAALDAVIQLRQGSGSVSPAVPAL